MTARGDWLRRDPLFPVLKGTVIERTGLAYWMDKDEALADLLAQVLVQRRTTATQMVADLAKEGGNGAATQALIDAATVGETFFFRYREQFEALEHVVLPEIIAHKRDARRLSIWSAGCSNGAEAYSLSIMLRRGFGARLAGWHVDILGTDINRSALAEAERAEYGEWAVRDLPEDVLGECFVRHRNRWQVRAAFRRGVRFAQHNLIKDPPPILPPQCFDLVVCRNVLMYFEGATRRRVLDQFHRVLADGGWLVVSHAEAGPQIGDHFSAVALPSCTLYRKVRSSMPVAEPPPLRARPPPPPPPPSPPPPQQRPAAEGDVQLEVQARALLDRGDFTRAVALCRNWSHAHPLDPAGHYFLGLALEPLAEEQAIAAFRRALFLAPHLVVAHFNLLRLLRRRGEHTQAERHYRAAMADLSALPGDQRLALAPHITAAELAAVVRRLGERR